MNPRILVIRLGAMGDVIHALPAVATLRQSFPHAFIAWAIETRWIPLIEGNPHFDQIIPVDRSSWRSLRDLHRQLRSLRFDFAVDLQGLIKSALVALAAGPERIYGFDHTQVRERLAALVYSHAIHARSAHVIDKNLDVVQAAGGTNPLRAFWLPQGRSEGQLPDGDFVLANPTAGWPAKQWPLGYYSDLGCRLRAECGVELVLSGSERVEIANTATHVSGLAGLIHATRRAVAVVGVDSGPMHLAAALAKPGVAIFGPTDPARNGPYGNTMTVLRAPRALTSYKRSEQISASMYDVGVVQVLQSLKARLACAVS